MKVELHVRPVEAGDYAGWRPLWDGYNAFYGRSGATALDERITARTWQWFFEPDANVQAHVATLGDEIVGLVHLVFHRSTSRLRDVCYLQDLFTSEAHRGRGVGRALIERVIAVAAQAGSSRVYWTTQETNAAGRALYDKVAEHRGVIVYTREIPDGHPA
ncbi:MAG TPA: GNAT family N-acetyltransferase [Ramlibacter sp.]|nr:GNAT family N-acetyltransferase [Ramlibacter sp.]